MMLADDTLEPANQMEIGQRSFNETSPFLFPSLLAQLRLPITSNSKTVFAVERLRMSYLMHELH
jgi:hypothetical protein